MFFNNRCNLLECCLKDRSYNEMVVRQQILKARKFNMKDLRNQDSKTKGKDKLVFNFTSLLLTPNAQHHKVFPEVLIFGFKRRKSLKDSLVRTKVPVEKETAGKSFGCLGKRCEVCTFLEEKTLLRTKRVVMHTG